ncbi:cytochrome bo3 quinol oxidase subunit 3 [Bradyrhizobium lablabi]|uniref:Cytochrome bo(3) ubiquinol oxidase subunit 3 n=3 Tax=Nitrobacteraceae TaxID=41294 RepID=A0ABY0PFL0_9BRAD|nr:cytochrome bo3 quinol oxidase subunit 3 [Bradyrhizobium ottawaense]SED71274.1 cytochrome bo3 quinol oxidase subunit 3 [Bradyrhizobium lablabi]SHL67396.1 cytochrome bo3 quinol oxidase subunit 3 [Bradyrhizobium lablabi]
MSTDVLTIETVVARGASASQPANMEEAEHIETGSTTVLGFWIYLMSDCLLFAALFATYAVLAGESAGGPTGRNLFSLPYVLTETVCLLLSSFTYGMAMLALNRGARVGVLRWLAITALLGLCFIAMEISEFHRMIGEGAGPDRSAFLSSFFALVGTHGLHVTSGLIWMAVMIAQVALRGLSATNRTRLICLSLFWHFLDIVWIGVFSVVYLTGSM